jgi:hypothetical protein
MNNQKLQDLIKNFSPEKLSPFLREKNSTFKPVRESLHQYNDADFIDGTKIGEIPFNLFESFIICAFKVNKSLSERSGKKAQYEKAKRILKEFQIDAGIFVFYDQKGCFRFSLVYSNYFGKKRDWSSFRRFTYFLSPDLTNKTFLDRIGKGDFSNLEAIKESFSVEKVTKDFYQEISYWYFWAVQKCKFPKDAELEENGRNISVIRLITRMIFIWFMRERGLIRKELFSQEFINENLKDHSADSSSYYQAILQNLFFATLSTKKSERVFRNGFRAKNGFNPDYGNQFVYRFIDYFEQPELIQNIFKDIPFLNGGLFDCLDDKDTGIYIDGFSEIKKYQPYVPNFLFFSDSEKIDINSELSTKNSNYNVRGLLKILSAFNFTIDENTLDDQEVALDPELLGRVFENLLASFNPETASTARKATGSYYTPREIVEYMVDESLKGYLSTHLQDIKDLENKLNQLFSSMDENNPFDESQSKKIVHLIESIRIVDPAVGSGAFPMGILNKLVFLLHKVDKDNKFWEQAQLDAVDDIPDFRIREEAKKRITLYFYEKNADYGRKLFLIQKCIYGVDIQQIAVEIAKLRFFVSLLVDEKIDYEQENWGIEPLPNLEFKIMQGNSLVSEFLGVSLDINKEPSSGQIPLEFINEKTISIKEFEHKKIEFQNESDRKNKNRLLIEIEDEMIKIFKNIVKAQKEIYFNALEDINRKYLSLPKTKITEDLISREILKVNQRFGFDLDYAEKQLRKYTGKTKTRPFFPWQLYFAEVFSDKDGFDIVIGNPPYVRVHKQDPEQKQYIREHYFSARGDFDLYIIFLERALKLINKKGVVTFITPDKYLVREYGNSIRNFIMENYSIVELYDISRAVDAFTASVYPLISIITGKTINQGVRIKFAKTISNLKMPLEEYTISQKELNKNGVIELITESNKKIITKIYDQSVSLGEIIKNEQIFCGTPRAKDYYNWAQGIVLIKTEATPKLIVCSNIKPYLIDHNKTIRTLGVKVYKPFFSNKKGLIGTNLWNSFIFKPKILIRGNDKRITAALDESPSVFIGVYGIKIYGELINYSKYLTAFLNSTICQWIFQKKNPSIKIGGGYFSINAPQILSLPFCKPDEELLININDLVDKIKEIKKDDSENNISKHLNQIDLIFYKIFNLSNDEINFIEKDLK